MTAIVVSSGLILIDQYPDYPGAKELVNEYITRSAALNTTFLRYVSECLSLPPTALEEFKGNMDRLKFIKYPQAPSQSQGVGPHKDSSGLFTFLSQDDTGGLQVLNKNGEWIDAPPIEGSLVVNIQQGLEAITGGVCAATTHRVMVSPKEFGRHERLLNRYRRRRTKQDIAFLSSPPCAWISRSKDCDHPRRTLSRESRLQMIERSALSMCPASSSLHSINAYVVPPNIRVYC